MLSAFKRGLRAVRQAEALEHSQFYKCQWQKQSGLLGGYVLYRWAVATVFIVVLLAAILDTGMESLNEFLKFFIYLTHWGFVLCTIQAIMGAVLVTKKYRQLKLLQTDEQRIESLRQPSLMAEIYWIIYTMSVVSSFGITIIFWTKVYIPDYHRWGIMIFLLHGLNSLLMFLDVIVVAHPLKFMHFLWTFGFVIIYLFFSYIYYLAGGTNTKNHPFIYHSLNWENPHNSLRFCTSSLIFGFFIHVCMWIFSAVVRKISGATANAVDINTSCDYQTPTVPPDVTEVTVNKELK